jgi:hypothetical protein
VINPFDCCYPLLLETVEHGVLCVTVRLLPVSGQMYPDLTSSVAVQVINVLQIRGDECRQLQINRALRDIIDRNQLREAILSMKWALSNDPLVPEKDANLIGCAIDLINFSST